MGFSPARDAMVRPSLGLLPEGADRRSRIVAAAHDLLDEDGLEGVTIRAVLDRTGLARRAFYDRFAGKDDLLLAVFAAAIEQATQQLDAMTRDVDDPLERLEHLVMGLMMGRGAFGMRDGEGNQLAAALTREHLRLAESKPAELQRVIAPLIGLIGQHLADGMERGVMRQGPLHWMATLVYNLVSTTMHSELLADDGVSDLGRRRQLAEQTWEFCRRALVA